MAKNKGFSSWFPGEIDDRQWCLRPLGERKKKEEGEPGLTLSSGKLFTLIL